MLVSQLRDNAGAIGEFLFAHSLFFEDQADSSRCLTGEKAVSWNFCNIDYSVDRADLCSRYVGIRRAMATTSLNAHT